MRNSSFLAARAGLSLSATSVLVVFGLACTSAPTNPKVTNDGGAAASSSASTGGTGGATSSSSAGGTGGAPATCGDGKVDPGEECDGEDFANLTCMDEGYANPSGLACTKKCTLDKTGCKAVCGNNAVEPGEECDDSNSAYSSCSVKCTPQGLGCDAPIPVSLPAGTLSFTAKTGENSSFNHPSCGGLAAGLVYQVTPASAGFLTVWTDPNQTNFDAVVGVRSLCSGAVDVACDDNNSGSPDLISIPVTTQPVFVVVGGKGTATGTFGLHMNLSQGTCTSPIPILLGDKSSAAVTAIGNTNSQGNSAGVASCQAPTSTAPDVVFEVTPLDTSASVEVTSLATTFTTALYGRGTCGASGASLGCFASEKTKNVTLDVSNPPAGFFVYVDGVTTADSGSYSVTFAAK